MNRVAVFFATAILSANVPAHAELAMVSATPAAGTTVAAPGTIELRMSEPLVPNLSGAAMVMTSMPGMADHAPMKMPAATSIAADGRSIVLKPSRKLPAGSYRVDWHAGSAATPRVTGTHLFSVK
jgi:methionine-rich copper-binding protein CopC